MKTGKILAYNSVLGRGIIEGRSNGRTYHFLASDVCFKEAGLLTEGIQVFFEVEEGSRKAERVEIMSTGFTRFKEELRKKGSIALD